jgi:hypothetical protein
MFFPNRNYSMKELSPLLPHGTWLGLPFCLFHRQSPFLLGAFSLMKLAKGLFFFIHFFHGREIEFEKRIKPLTLCLKGGGVLTIGYEFIFFGNML